MSLLLRLLRQLAGQYAWVADEVIAPD